MSHVLLTLAISDLHEEALVDFLLDLPRPPEEITFVNGHAIGPQVPLHTPHERVKGRARRAVVQVILELDQAAPLLAQLGRAFAGKRLAYWLTPVIEHGEF